MINIKNEIINSICYTDLAYQRIRKKLGIEVSNEAIEHMIIDLLIRTPDKDYKKIGKNYYISNSNENVKLTINSNTYRLITVDHLK